MSSSYTDYNSFNGVPAYAYRLEDGFSELISPTQPFTNTTTGFEQQTLTSMSLPQPFFGQTYCDPPRNDSLFPLASPGTMAMPHMSYDGQPSMMLPAAPQTQRFSASSESSLQSASSSSMNSPHLAAQFTADWTMMTTQDSMGQSYIFSTSGDQNIGKSPSFVDPSMLNPFSVYTQYPAVPQSNSMLYTEQETSPQATPRIGKAKKSPLPSPVGQAFPAYPYGSRRQSTSSQMSRNSSQRSGSFEVDEVEGRGTCPIPDCGKAFKDLKAHMLTHQNERPEKCPIPSCDYHTKGFARKYDKNRHTLTHYKGTMVCGFCPGTGSSSEKTFNRADVFKRHLTTVHGVEQVPPNARRKSPGSRKGGATNVVGQSGQCSTCSLMFASPQEFYEHLDDCVLRVVQQIDPAEGINEKHLTTISEAKEVQDMLEKHNLTGEYNVSFDEASDDEDDDRTIKGVSKIKSEKSGAGTSWNTSNGRINKRRTGLTLSKGGVRLAGPPNSGRKKRKNYPASWGSSPDKMRMKKRVLCVYDGQRRLWKDDLMLDAEYEVRIPLPSNDGRSYVTDLDVQTHRRAQAIFDATEEERGPWNPDNVIDFEQDPILM